jgi:hypothetical protein
MKRRPDNPESEPPKEDHPEERLREFIEQRFPGGVPLPESVREESTDAGSAPGQGEPDQSAEAQMDRLELTFQEIIESLKRVEVRLDQLDQTVQTLAETQKRIEAQLGRIQPH